jgi:hypothetical protein
MYHKERAPPARPAERVEQNALEPTSLTAYQR